MIMTGKNPLNLILKIFASPFILLIIITAVFMSVIALFTGKKKVRRTLNVSAPRTINEPTIMLLESKPKVLFLEHKRLGE